MNQRLLFFHLPILSCANIDLEKCKSLCDPLLNLTLGPTLHVPFPVGDPSQSEAEEDGDSSGNYHQETPSSMQMIKTLRRRRQVSATNCMKS